MTAYTKYTYNTTLPLAYTSGTGQTKNGVISGLRTFNSVYTVSSDILTTKTFDGIREAFTNISGNCALFCKLYIPPTEDVDSPTGARGDWVCFQRQYSKNYYVQQFAWNVGVVDRVWTRVWRETEWSNWKLLVDAS